MNTDPIHNLLFRADSAAPPPVVRVGLAERVRRTARRRWLRDHALILLTAVTACGAALSISRRSHPVAARVDAAPAKLAEVRAELAQLDVDARTHLQIAADLQRHKAHQAEAEIGLADLAHRSPGDRIAGARERAALILVREADRTATDPANQKQADRLYSRAARLFPDTSAGRTARQRINQTTPPI